MYLLLLILSIIAAILLICVILVQKSKGGGLSSTFAGSNQIMGVRRTNSFIEKLTWTLGGAIAVLAILSTFVMPSALTVSGSRVQAPVDQQAGANYDQNAEASGETAAPAAADQAAAPAAAEGEKAEAPKDAAPADAKAADDKAAAPAEQAAPTEEKKAE